MTERQRLLSAVAVLLAVICFGTVGFVLIEDLSVTDALYETMITISTVGYAEPAGGLGPAGRLFTVSLILVGVGALFYTAVTALELLIEEMVGGDRRQRREDKMIAKLEGHAIVCGYGRVGTSVAKRLAARDIELVIVDAGEERIEIARAYGFATVRGDATHEDVLSAAGLDRARVLIACVHGDSDNLSIVLSARVRQPDLYVLARASDQEAERRIKMAGADRVITPPEVGAERLAALVLHPGLTEFVDIAAGGTLFEFRVEELTLSTASELAGKTLAESRIRTRVGASILAIRHSGGKVTTNPGATMPLGVDDVLVAMGTPEQLMELEKLV